MHRASEGLPGWQRVYPYIVYRDILSCCQDCFSLDLISLIATLGWPFDVGQLEIKNAFLHGDLQEGMYMEQPPGFVVQGESKKVCRLDLVSL